jgi:hypothetical protein
LENLIKNNNLYKNNCKNNSNFEEGLFEEIIEVYDEEVPIERPNKKKKRGKGRKPVKCFKCKVDDCELLFDNEEDMNKHFDRHDKITILPCRSCEKIFIKEENFKKHDKTHRPTNKMFSCSFPGCKKKFTASYNQKVYLI